MNKRFFHKNQYFEIQRNSQHFIHTYSSKKKRKKKWRTHDLLINILQSTTYFTCNGQVTKFNYIIESYLLNGKDTDSGCPHD